MIADFLSLKFSLGVTSMKFSIYKQGKLVKDNQSTSLMFRLIGVLALRFIA